VAGADERLLAAAVIVAYLVVVAIAAWRISRRGDGLLEMVRNDIDAERWRALGAPRSVRAAMGDPQRRWTSFVNGGEYRRVCSRRVRVEIESYRRWGQRVLLVLVGIGIAIVVGFWGVLEPVLLR
jgi:hypothetical protein